MWKTIFDILFPIHCLGCGQEDNFVCLSCFKKIPLNTKKPRNNLLIASYYNNPLIKQIIHRYKYDFVKDLAKPLSLLMIKKLQDSLEVGPRVSDLVLIPIPLYKKRLRWRGFNQAELLAQEIGQKLNIPVINNLLIRTKNTLPQATIENAQERKQNINQAFSLESIEVEDGLEVGLNFVISKLTGKTLILIDDVSTTGATLDQATQALLSLNPKQIWKLVVARG